MSTDIVIVGAGGFGHEVMDYVQDLARVDRGIRLVGFLDDDQEKLSALPPEFSVRSPIDAYQPKVAHHLLLAIGSPKIRKHVADRLKSSNRPFYTLIHPLAYVSHQATIGEGVVICPFAFVGARASVGDHAVLNNFASCSHDSIMESYSVLSPYAALNGNAILQEGGFLGSHAVVTPSCRVGAWAVVGASATVLSPVASGVTAVGTPAVEKAT